MKRLSENKFMMAMPLLLDILSLLCFLLYFWSASHAPYNYVNVMRMLSEQIIILPDQRYHLH